MKKPRIESIVIQQILDECPDTSHLGEFTGRNQDGDDLKRGSVFEHDKGNNRTLDYFVPMMSVEEHRKGLVKMGYSKGQAEEMSRSYCKADYERILALDRGDFCYIGIKAKAVVSIPIPNNPGCVRLETLTSGGLWGVESDSGDYLDEVAQEELNDLKSHLKAFGVYIRNFNQFAKEAEVQEPY